MATQLSRQQQEERRALALELLKSGYSAVEVAQRVEVSERTVYKWISKYLVTTKEDIEVLSQVSEFLEKTEPEKMQQIRHKALLCVEKFTEWLDKYMGTMQHRDMIAAAKLASEIARLTGSGAAIQLNHNTINSYGEVLKTGVYERRVEELPELPGDE